MSKTELFIGDIPIKNNGREITGEYVIKNGVHYYKIANYDAMRPFFMTIVSNSDHWLFISSNGALTAGRKNQNLALFPYYTDDKITDSSELTGNKSIFKVIKNGKRFLWEPFSERYAGIYAIKRNIYKARIGNKILFEEINEDLQLVFSYSWSFSEMFGFVKKSSLVSLSDKSIELEVLDGIQNILPFGISSDLQNQKSTLIDAYKKNELDQKSGIGQFMLSAMIVDKAEPSEALKTSIVWSTGIEANDYLLSSQQLNAIRKGHDLTNETDVKAERGAYFINSSLSISASGRKDWFIVAEVNQSYSDLIKLKKKLENKSLLVELLENDEKEGTKKLLELVAKADGLQLTNDKLSTGRHFSNVLFNIMRGGVFEENYQVDINDLKEYVLSINKTVFERYLTSFVEINTNISYQELLMIADSSKDLDFQRIIFEYLPLSFSRRHGDPSRPWNLFSIEISNKDGNKIRNYEGNWRDIFQNWEALAYSFPDYVESMITKFVNASTIDGYNPYRITRKGIDWEVVEPDDPWSYIGYWGDHQIIYLLKLLEISKAHHPERLSTLLTKELYVYANVPYKIKGYNAILSNPSDTIEFDHDLAHIIEARVNQVGSDGKLVWNDKGQIIRANLAEKILVSVLTKLYNFIPEAGIWLNTQRPEWNDANNALVGNGVSMVTLYHLRRFLNFGIKLFERLDSKVIDLNEAIADLLDDLYIAFSSRLTLLEGLFSDYARKEMMDDLGKAGEEYRKKAYDGFSGELRHVNPMGIISMFYVALEFVDHSIKLNKREDGLYHSYNLIDVTRKEAKVEHLYEMLEGQVAILTSQYLGAEEASSLLDTLKSSKMYREDQYSYMLYPDRILPKFLQKNTLPREFAKKSELIQELVDKNDTSLIERDINGDYHFNGDFHNVNDLVNSLEALALGGYDSLVRNEQVSILDIFEKTFNHRSFTGRSGTFYGYEGLGSIYWHMVSKLLMSVQETIYAAHKQLASAETIGNLTNHYYEIRAGIGVNKSPELYGAFPTDAYSHTPGNAGAQQPGMTGQVKEDIINRWAELGIKVKNGQIEFKPSFLRTEEFLKEESDFIYYNIRGEEKLLSLSLNSLAFTYCQVPIIYIRHHKNGLEVHFSNGAIEVLKNNSLSPELSKDIFGRSGKVEKIVCFQTV